VQNLAALKREQFGDLRLKLVLTSSSASKLRIQSPVALSMAEFFCAAKPFHSSTKTFAPNDFATSTVLSVEPESTTMISPLPSLPALSRSLASAQGSLLRYA